MKVGITGTRLGISIKAIHKLEDTLIELQATELHHGDCCGADSQAHDVAKRLDIRVVGHPPLKAELRAFRKFDEERPAKDYLVRNRDIVNEVEHLIALPDGPERTRSGTWSTVRYARKLGKPVTTIAGE
jgi:hypothetical protein